MPSNRFIVLLLALAAALSPGRVLAGECDAAQPGDPLRVYLLTLTPADDLFSKFGHSALWVSGDKIRGDLVFNWGAFSTKRQDPVDAFLDGRMRYFLDLGPLSSLRGRAVAHRRTMVAQRLDIPVDRTDRLVGLLEEAARPENREYQYDWAENNCATRIRDLLDSVLDGELRRRFGVEAGLTRRMEVLRHLSVVPWAWFGWDFLAGSAADRPISRYDAMFVPDRLMQGVTEVEVGGRPLVTETCTLLDGALPWPPAAAPVWWPWTLGLGSLWGVGIARAGRRVGGVLMVLLGLLAGALGSATVWLSVTSAIEGLSPNANWFVASPGTLVLVPAGVAVALGVGGVGRRLMVGLVAALALVGLAGLAGGPLLGQDSLVVLGLFLPPLVASAWVVRR